MYLNQKNFKNFTFHVLNEHLKISPVVFYFPKNSMLVKAFNEKISVLKAAGLIDYWISQHMNVQYIKMKNKAIGPRRMTLQQLIAVFNILIVGCAVGSVSFILELLWLKLTIRLLAT